MTTTLLRIIKYGVHSFRRNALISVATIIVMVLALTMFEGLIIFNTVAATAISSLQDKIDISVYFKTNAPEDDILKVQKSLESLKEVKNTEYVSRDKALELFQQKYADNQVISQALKELEDNPLSASLNIKAHDPGDYEKINQYLEASSFKERIEKITFGQSRVAIERLAKIVDTAKKIGLALTIFLAITAVLVVFNTIHLAIYSNREEIGIMRLVGASNVFINGPYFVEAIIFAIFAAVTSVVLTAPFISFSSPYIQSFIPEMVLTDYFVGNLFSLFFYQLVFGIVLAVLSSAIATRRYLKI